MYSVADIVRKSVVLTDFQQPAPIPLVWKNSQHEANLNLNLNSHSPN